MMKVVKFLMATFVALLYVNSCYCAVPDEYDISYGIKSVKEKSGLFNEPSGEQVKDVVEIHEGMAVVLLKIIPAHAPYYPLLLMQNRKGQVFYITDETAIKDLERGDIIRYRYTEYRKQYLKRDGDKMILLREEFEGFLLQFKKIGKMSEEQMPGKSAHL